MKLTKAEFKRSVSTQKKKKKKKERYMRKQKKNQKYKKIEKRNNKKKNEEKEEEEVSRSYGKTNRRRDFDSNRIIRKRKLIIKK